MQRRATMQGWVGFDVACVLARVGTVGGMTLLLLPFLSVFLFLLLSSPPSCSSCLSNPSQLHLNTSTPPQPPPPRALAAAARAQDKLRRLERYLKTVPTAEEYEVRARAAHSPSREPMVPIPSREIVCVCVCVRVCVCVSLSLSLCIVRSIP